jgi:hypothetical protein
MEGNSYVMDIVVDGLLLARNKTHQVIDDASDKVFNYCC